MPLNARFRCPILRKVPMLLMLGTVHRPPKTGMGSPLSLLRKTIVLMVGLAFVLSVPLAFSTPAAAEIVPITLYGSRAGGWGSTNASLMIPGPPLTVHVGDNVSMSLFSADSITHRWFIDYNNNSAAGGSEPRSLPFASPTTAVVFNFTVANVTGTYRYRSDQAAGPGTDVTNMWGNITILNATAGGGLFGADNTVLIVVGVVIIIIAVLAVATMYMRRSKKPRKEPPPPP